MERLKFRAWTQHEGKMYMFAWEEYKTLICEWIANGERHVIIEQFTGLRDRNGKEIYEGDIVKCMHGNCPVEFGKYVTGNENNEDILGLMVIGEHSAHAFDPQGAYWVIGNIHENPEPLK